MIRNQGSDGTKRHKGRLKITYPGSRIKVGTGKMLLKRANRLQAAKAIKSE